ncbi:MAG: molecular chaperone HtpG [Lachnospiraceae bacterium]|nr:molecular chaperone HtpG [Lachnospiraceae bacterium]
MNTEQGSLSINSENIFPIIKKWLYSDHDIFYRELVSNGCDAITKLKKLSLIGEFEPADDEQYKLEVIINPDEKTIKIVDNGVGMTADEVKQYINQIAFSGAAAFLEKYKDKTSEDQIIGHFGLGFYSAFMVADKVTIDTLSYQKDATAVHWESEGGTEFTMEDSDKETRGTEITLYLNEDSYEFCNEYRAREVLMKYCSFMPVEIYLINATAEPEEEDEEDDVIDATVNEDGTATESEETEEKTEEAEEEPKKKGPKPINETVPLWAKHPNECTDDEYKDFYREVFHDYKEPLFWIHLNMDYPFNLKGILYFPKINTEYDSIEGTIKLYNNQVFIADNIKEVIPEFLMLLKGAIDCPDLPLNVSRSALQNDGFVKKISEYITKKVADKLSGMYKTERETYEKYWDDISPFIKFGCLKDSKFEEKIKDYIIFKNLEDKYITLAEYNKDETGTKDNKKNIFYITDLKQQGQYINMFKEEGLDALILTHNIDQPFITSLESKDETIKFMRIDSDLTGSFKEEVAEGEDADKLKEEADALSELFKKVLNNDKLEVKVEKLKNAEISSMVTLSEESRRMADMMKMYSMPGMDTSMFGANETLILNANNKLVKYVFDNKEGENVEMVCKQLYDLALISYKQLEPEKMTEFIARSNKIMMLMLDVQ